MPTEKPYSVVSPAGSACGSFNIVIRPGEGTKFSDQAIVTVREAMQAFNAKGILKTLTSHGDFRAWLKRNQNAIM